MIRIKNAPVAREERDFFEADEGGSGALFQASDLLALAGETHASAAMSAIASRMQYLEGFLADDPDAAPDSWVCFTLTAEETATMTRLLRKLERLEGSLISGDFRLLPQHVERWTREFQGLGVEVPGDPPNVLLWKPYQAVYRTLAVLKTAERDGREVELCVCK